jgi:isoleucyl-tRNA synthetase
MRWIFLGQNPSQNLLFGWHGAHEVKRKLLTLWNVYSFLVTYARIDNLNPAQLQIAPGQRSALDRWVLSRLNTLVGLTRERLDEYDAAPATRAIEEFIDDLSVWYVRRSRRRFWKPASDSDKHAAYRTLYDCLTTLTRLVAPFMPFLAEELYQNLVRSVNPEAPESVHLDSYPVPDVTLVDPKLEAEIALVRSAVSSGRAAREKSKLKVRQPLSAVMVRAAKPEDRETVLRHADEVKEELNVRDILFTEPGAQFPPDYVVEEAPDSAVGVCTKLTPELENEGLARELVHKVQNLRKEAGFEVADRIMLHYRGTPRLAEAITAFRDYIARETLALSVTDEPAAEADIRREAKINREPAELALKRVRTT